MTGIGAEQGRVDVEGPAGDDQTIDALQILIRLIGLVRQQDGQAPGALDRIGDLMTSWEKTYGTPYV